MSNSKLCSVSFNKPSGKFVIRYFDEKDDLVDDSFYPIIEPCDDHVYVDAEIFNRLQELVDDGFKIIIY